MIKLTVLQTIDNSSKKEICLISQSLAGRTVIVVELSRNSIWIMFYFELYVKLFFDHKVSPA